MCNYGRVAFSNNRHRAVCSHALWGHGHLWARCSSQRPALGRRFARPLGAWAPMGEVLFSKTRGLSSWPAGQTCSLPFIHSRQGGPTASQAIGFRNHSGVIIHRRWCRNHSEHRRCRDHSAVNSGWGHHRIICVIIIAVGGQRWQDSSIIIEVGSAELQPHFTWLAGLNCSLTSHGRRKQNSSPAQTR
jgi:hypothetical protein